MGTGDHIGHARTFWPDPVTGPYVVETYWRPIDGHLECVGLKLASFDDVLGPDEIRPAGEDYQPVSPSQLRKVPWREILDGYRRYARETGALIGMTHAERELVAERLLAAGLDPETASMGEWLSATPAEIQERALNRQPSSPEPGRQPDAARGGRPPLHTEADWRRRALIYLDAVRRGESPNVAVAREEHVSVQTARTWAAMLRKKGLLPKPAGPGRPSRQSKEDG